MPLSTIFQLLLYRSVLLDFFFCTYIFSTYVKHIIIFIPLKLYTSFTGLTIAC